MARIALKAYLREISDLIDNSQIDEAISHCRHILEQYPKHVETYRLLGKAYLEVQRYSDAADILQRVLSSVPDDFISHVGMSIIREDEGNIDAAIYHMELAFETQPSNHAIQDELRRLQAVRDGVEPLRIRLTRGALSRMYAHGHLYDQAIAELQAALSEDSKRLDLLTLLAEMYYQADKKVDAAETCTKILEKLPYCLSANRLLATILQESGRSAEADRFKMRWESLDPYAQFVDEDYPTIDQVPGESITIQRQEWEPDFLSGEADQPAWASSLGMTIEEEAQAKSAEVPDWLSPADEGQSGPSGIAEDTAATEVDFPALSGEAKEEDWLRMGEESGEEGLFEDQEGEPVAEKSDLDFFDSLKSETEEDESLPDFLAEFGEGEEAKEEEEEAEPDWLTSFGEPEEERPSLFDEEAEEEEDDWLASLESAESDTSPSAVSGEETEEEEEEPDWLTSFGEPEEEKPSLFDEEEAEEEEDDWLASLESAESDTSPSAISGQETEEEEDDWLTTLDTQGETSPTSIEAAEEEEEEDDWLASLESAESDTSPSATSGQEPEEEGDDWLAALESQEETSPTSIEATEEKEEEDDWLTSFKSTSEQASLEPEEPEQAEAEIPDFLRDAGWEERTGDEDEFEPVEYLDEDAESDEIEQGELPPWLQDMAPEEKEPEPPTGELMADLDPDWVAEADKEDLDKPDWLSELDQEEEVEDLLATSTPEEKPEQGVEIEAEDVDMAWLESLAAKQGIPDEELVTSAEQRSQVSEDHTPEAGIEQEAEDTFSADWKDESDQEAEPATPEETDDDSWLAEFGAPADEVEEETLLPAETLSLEIEEEEEEDLDTGWLDSLASEAAEEAAQTSIEAEAAPAEEAEEEGDDWLAGLGTDTVEAEEEDDWLAGLGTSEEEDQEETTAFADTPSLDIVEKEKEEDEEELDTDWLDNLASQAAEEAAQTSIEAEEEPAEEAEEEGDDWLAGLGTDTVEAEEEDDWLAGLGTSEEEDQEETSTQAETLYSEIEEEDELDTDWLGSLASEAAEEAAQTSIEAEAAPVEEAKEEEDDWLAGLGTSEEESEEETSAPAETFSLEMTEEEDELDTDWLDSLASEAAEEAAETSFEAEAKLTEEAKEGEDDWLASLDASEEESEEETSVPDETLALEFEDQKDDELDAGWLDNLASEAAEEAAQTSLEDETEAKPAEVVKEEEEEDDWLAGLELEEEIESVPSQPVLEEEDDFDMDWLEEIGQEAAQEAADTSFEAPTQEEPVEEEDEEWLAGLGIEETPESEPSQPVLEEEDDFDMDWLEEIGQEAAEEAAETTLEASTMTEPGSEAEDEEDDWLAELAEQTEEEEDDWLKEISEPSEETEEEQTTSESEPLSGTSMEEEDVFDTDWLREIGQEAAQEAAETTIEPPQEEEEPAEPPADVTAPWLSAIARETDSAQTPSDDDTLAQFISRVDAEEPAQEEPPVDQAEEEEEPGFDMDWFNEISREEPAPPSDMDEVEEEIETPSRPEPVPQDEEPVLDIEDTGEWLASLGVEEPESQPRAVEKEPETGEEHPFEAEEEPDWLEETTPAGQAEVAPTQSEEWVPESRMEAKAEPEPEPAPFAEESKPDPKSPEGILATARDTMQSGNLEEAIGSYNKLIKKGKMVDTVIEDILEATQRYPVEYSLWQILGDAYLRVDNLQDALDAYTKAEELLR